MRIFSSSGWSRTDALGNSHPVFSAPRIFFLNFFSEPISLSPLPTWEILRLSVLKKLFQLKIKEETFILFNCFLLTISVWHALSFACVWGSWIVSIFCVCGFGAGTIYWVWLSRASGLQNVYFNFIAPPVLTSKCKYVNKHYCLFKKTLKDKRTFWESLIY